jgi:hypothetical protein
MSQHVFAWVAGFGWTLMPYAPFRFERVSGRPRSICVEHSSPSGVGRVVIGISDDGQKVRSEPAHKEGPRIEVVELIEGAAFPHWDHGAAYDHWRVETSLLSVSWPEGFAVRSVADAPPAFELVGPDAALIWVQGPFANEALPSLERMVGPGQTTERTFETAGGPMLELRYLHDGASWHMFHCVVDHYAGAACVVTGQTPVGWRELVRAAVEEVAASLTPCPPE